MIKAFGYAAQSAKSPLAPFHFERRSVGPRDVLIEILYSGICHSDLHQVRNEWGNSTFPMVPGHEIVGLVLEVGAQVTKLKVGDIAGVGCLVDACGDCRQCRDGHEQFCEKGAAMTYNGTLPGRQPGLGRVRGRHRGRRGLRAAYSAQSRPGRGGPSALRRHHHLVASQALERRPRHARRRDRTRRPRSYGAQVRARLRRTRDAVYDLARQGR